jgi:hypothetical protein
MINSIHAVKHAVFDKVYKTWILTSCVATEKEKFMLTLGRFSEKPSKITTNLET